MSVFLSNVCACIRMSLCHTLQLSFVYTWVFSHILQCLYTHEVFMLYRQIFYGTRKYFAYFTGSADTVHRCKGLLGRAHVPLTPPWRAKASTHCRTLNIDQHMADCHTVCLRPTHGRLTHSLTSTHTDLNTGHSTCESGYSSGRYKKGQSITQGADLNDVTQFELHIAAWPPYRGLTSIRCATSIEVCPRVVF